MRTRLQMVRIVMAGLGLVLAGCGGGGGGGGQTPTVSFTRNPPRGVDPGATVQFDGSATAIPGSPNTPVEVAWGFGDGTPATAWSTTKTISHAFMAAGDYTVTLYGRAQGQTTSTGSAAKATGLVHVHTNEAPAVDFSVAPGPVNAGTALTFTAAATDDRDLPNELKYKWDFHDGTVIDYGNPGDNMTVTHTFNNRAAMPVTLYAMDTSGLEGSKTKDATVNMAPKVAVVVNPNPVVGGNATVFDMSGTTDEDNAVNTLQYRIDFEGTGTYTQWQTWPTGGTVSHTYGTVTTPRTVNAVVQAKDPGGLTGQATVVVTINPSTPGNQPPVGSFTVSPASGDTTTTLQFDPSASTDAEEPATVQVRFDFGDNTPVTAWASPSMLVTHRYLVPGTYTVTLNVKDSVAAGPNVTKNVIVSSLAAPVAYRSFSAYGYTAGSPITVTVTVNPGSAAQNQAIEDQTPAGWTISNISNSGSFDSTNSKVKWGPFFDNSPRTLTYQATPPAGTTGAVTFSGTLSVDGVNSSLLGVQTISNL